MKKYIIMTYRIGPMGGTQTYTAAKAKWLEEHGWDVSVLCNRQDDEKYVIPYLSKFHKGRIWWFNSSPEDYSRADCSLIVKYMGKLCGIDSKKYDEIIIESHYNEAHLWGELLAQKYGARNFCLLVNEVYRSPVRHYEYYFPFYDFKLARHEIGGDMRRLNKLFDSHRVITQNEENRFYISESPVADVECEAVNRIEHMDYNICFTSRMEKVYVPTVIKEVALFAQNHSDKSVQLILVGDTKCVDPLIDELGTVANLSFLKLGVLSPIPRSIINKAEVFVGGSGCAHFPASEGALTIAIDAISCKAIGILGYETTNNLYAGEEDNPMPLSMVLERALIEKSYLDKEYYYPAMNNDECCRQNMELINNAEKTLSYYPKEKLCSGYIKSTPKHHIGRYLRLFHPNIYDRLKKIPGIRHICGKIQRHLFPKQMQLRDLKREHAASLKELETLKCLSNEEIIVIQTEQYKERTGHTLNLHNPERFTEKIQWRKAYDRDPVYSELTDKYRVRNWVEKKIGGGYLIPLLGVWEKAEDIDFHSLPDRFVLKTNNGSATNTIVTDKKSIDQRIVRENYRYWLEYPFGFRSMEMHYNAVKPLVIAEKYMKQNDKSDLTDYKFFCFHGVPMYCQVISDRSTGECIDFFDMEWNHQNYRFNNYGNAENEIARPKLLDEMKRLAKKLSEGFEFVRVDFYEIDNRIYFGEMAFTPASGNNTFTPDEWDYQLGRLWDITKPQIDYDIVGLGKID